MRQVSQNYKSGLVKIESVNLPALKPGGLLIKTDFSVISSGTEGMKVKEGKMGYLAKARARPDQVKKVLNSIQQQGVTATFHKVMNKLDSLTPLGYSASGVVIAVGAGAEEFHVGQKVACGGAGYANHAEVNFVPKNLVVPVPDNVSMESASFATIGSIALHGFRQSEMQLGETACVIGLGLLGQLLVQILRAAGMVVIGVDLVQSRCDLAEKLGANAGMAPNDPELKTYVNRITNGIGVDCVFIAAGGNTNGPVELAVEVSRDRGRVVDIGKTKLDLSWNDYYLKELDVRFSRSYGPGRYDPNYEEKGVDYPVGYVRWTERRNMSAFIQLLSKGAVSVTQIIESIHPFNEAEKVYEELANGSATTLGAIFKHEASVEYINRMPNFNASFLRNTEVQLLPDGKVSIGLIGAGNYALSMLLPHLVQNEDVYFREVATASSLSATDAGRKIDFERISTDYKGLLAADDIDAVIIATPHSSHSKMVSEGLKAGKKVFVEKPLAINIDGLKQVYQSVIDSKNDNLMVGFNRRFSPLVTNMIEIGTAGRSAPLVMHYRVHAGQLDGGSWYLDSELQGSRFTGEAGHFFDVFSSLVNCRPVSVFARCLRPENIAQDDLENIAVTVEYEDGSMGNLLYLTQGSIKVPKEYLEVYGRGETLQLHNFEYLMVYDSNGQKKIKIGAHDKGQKQEMTLFIEAVKNRTKMPISLESIFDSTLITIAVSESLRSGESVNLSDYCICFK